MAINNGTGAGNTASSETTAAGDGLPAVSELDDALKAVQPDVSDDPLVKALDGEIKHLVNPPAVKKVYTFTSPADPNTTFWFYPNAIALKKRDFNGRIGKERDDPQPIAVKFFQGRFTTDDERMAKLMEYHIHAWPRTYGAIQSGMKAMVGMQKRIEEFRKKAAFAMTADGLADTARSEQLIKQVERLAASDNMAAAEKLLNAAHTLASANVDNQAHA